jgi:hypothetical protein
MTLQMHSCKQMNVVLIVTEDDTDTPCISLHSDFAHLVCFLHFSPSLAVSEFPVPFCASPLSRACHPLPAPLSRAFRRFRPLSRASADIPVHRPMFLELPFVTLQTSDHFP